MNNNTQEYWNKLVNNREKLRANYNESRGAVPNATLTCPVDKSSLVCNKDSNGKEYVGQCIGETPSAFARIEPCEDENVINEICKDGFVKNVCNQNCPSDTSSLVCNEDSSGNKQVGKCYGDNESNRFISIEACEDKKEKICKNGFVKNVCNQEERKMQVVQKKPCPNIESLACKLGQDGNNLIGECINNTFLPIPSCSDSNYAVVKCQEKGYSKNPCNLNNVDSKGNNLVLNMVGTKSESGEVQSYNWYPNQKNGETSPYSNQSFYSSIEGTQQQQPQAATQQQQPQAGTQQQQPQAATQQQDGAHSGYKNQESTVNYEERAATQAVSEKCQGLDKMACQDNPNCYYEPITPSCVNYNDYILDYTSQDYTGMENNISSADSIRMYNQAINSEMTSYKTSTGIDAANSIVMDELLKNIQNSSNEPGIDGKDSSKTPISYYIHEVSDNGESRLYEYSYDDYNALIEQKQREEKVKKEMEYVKDKKLLIDNRGKKYYYNPKTDELSSYKDGRNIDTKIENLKKRVKSISVNKKESKKNKNSRISKQSQEPNKPKIDNNSIVYLNNNFGNSEHPEATTEVSLNKSGKVNEVKVSKKEAKKMIEENIKNQNEATEEMEEELAEAEVKNEVENKEVKIKLPKLSIFDKLVIAGLLLGVVVLVVWLLNKRFNFIPTRATSNTPRFQVVSNYNRVLSKVRRNLN